MALPTGRLMAALIGASVTVGAAWIGVTLALGKSGEIVAAGAWATIIVALCTTGGLLAITPWKQRPVSLWISVWMGQTVVRLFVTPAVAFLLYSATSSMSPVPFSLAIGFTYMAAVLSEAGVLAPYMQRSGSR